MRTIENTLSLMAVFIIIFAASCSKGSTAKPTPPVTTAKFTFKLDGTAITIDSANALLYSSGGTRMIDVYAYKSGAEILEFHFTPAAGTKTVGAALGAGALLTYMESPVLSYDSQSGTLDLTTCDTTGNKLEGDFNFVAKQYPYTGSTTKTITEGHMVVTRIDK